jgi:hypothetical protein
MRTHARCVPAIVAALVSLTVTGAFSATPVLAAEACPNEQLRHESLINSATGQPYSTQLPNCRAYELVSSPNTGGMPAMPGEAFLGLHEVLITPDGSVFWQSQATPDGTGAVPHGGYLNVFRSRRTPAGWITKDMLPDAQPGDQSLEAASADGERILIETTLTLSPEDLDDPTGNVTTGGDLYVVDADGTAPKLVTHGEVPNTLLGQGPVANSLLRLGSITVKALTNPELTAVGFVTNDSLATPIPPELSTRGCYVWTEVDGGLAEPTSPNEGGTGSPTLNCQYFGLAADGRPIIEASNGLIYAADPAERATLGGGGTRQLSGSTPHAAAFDAMSPAATTVYLTTLEELAPGAAGETVANIYAVGLDGLPTSCISCEADGSPNAAEPQYVGESADGTHVYFTVAGALYEHDAAGTQELAPATDELHSLVFSANGEHIGAETAVALSSSDTNGTLDIYELSAGSEPKLITNGAVASGSYRPVAVSNNGQQVVYEAGGGEQPSVIEEWVAGHTAQLSPLGSPRAYDVLATTGPELEDVFFASNEPLVAQDENAGTTDIYDARTDGGFPVPTEPVSNATTPNPVAAAISAYTGNLTLPSPVLSSLPADTSQPAPTVVKTRPLTRAQKLTKALQACRRYRKKRELIACDKTERNRYGGKSSTAKRKNGGKS